MAFRPTTFIFVICNNNRILSGHPLNIDCKAVYHLGDYQTIDLNSYRIRKVCPCAADVTYSVINFHRTNE
jgi:hypothetical protein